MLLPISIAFTCAVPLLATELMWPPAKVIMRSLSPPLTFIKSSASEPSSFVSSCELVTQVPLIRASRKLISPSSQTFEPDVTSTLSTSTVAVEELVNVPETTSVASELSGFCPLVSSIAVVLMEPLLFAVPVMQSVPLLKPSLPPSSIVRVESVTSPS